MNIAVGASIPDFEVKDQSGKLVSNKKLLGKKYILFFYPKDDSPSCTKEACSIRDRYKDIKKKGYLVFGVSPDTERKHLSFIEKYEFQYPLLSDPDLKMTNAFGLYGPKVFMGKDIVGVYRTTVIVNEEGVIEHIISKVTTAKHAEQILDLI